MSQEISLRVTFFAIMAYCLARLVDSRHDEVPDTFPDIDNWPRYRPYISGALLPGYLFALLIVGPLFVGFTDTARSVLSICFSIFLHISLYYLVLLMLLLQLRKFISARACAMLWLIPNYLYLIQRDGLDLPSPLLVVTAKGNLAWIMFGIWAAGFVVVLIWKCIEHLIFRRSILRKARPVTDPEIIRIWKVLLANSRFEKPKFKLVTSPNVTTPLTIGLFKRSSRVVLPEKPYTTEELELILHHELVHIGREDAWTKFFMVFCTAMCWFNPLMWIAMRRSADDLELSCDETVLLNAGEATRKRYAFLLLNTAGDQRGFTTCLSATAGALRYRLARITRPVRRRSGALIVGAAFFILCMTSGYVALAYDGESATEVLNLSDASIQTLADENITDSEAFHEYLTGLTLCRLTGNYSFSDSEHHFDLRLNTPDGVDAVILYDNAVKVLPLHGDRVYATYYYVPGGIDWAYLETLIA